MVNTKKDYQKILGSVQKPVKGEAGKTGSWSPKKPIIDLEKCIPVKSGKPSCFNCWFGRHGYSSVGSFYNEIVYWPADDAHHCSVSRLCRIIY